MWYYQIRIYLTGFKQHTVYRCWHLADIDYVHRTVERWARLHYLHNLHRVDCAILSERHYIIHSQLFGNVKIPPFRPDALERAIQVLQGPGQRA